MDTILSTAAQTYRILEFRGLVLGPVHGKEFYFSLLQQFHTMPKFGTSYKALRHSARLIRAQVDSEWRMEVEGEGMAQNSIRALRGPIQASRLDHAGLS